MSARFAHLADQDPYRMDLLAMGLGFQDRMASGQMETRVTNLNGLAGPWVSGIGGRDSGVRAWRAFCQQESR